MNAISKGMNRQENEERGGRGSKATLLPANKSVGFGMVHGSKRWWVKI